MVTVAQQCHPVLGDRPETFAQRFGAPRAIFPAAGGIVRRFGDRAPLAVLFIAGQAVAILSPYGTGTIVSAFWPPEPPGRPRVLVADAGWLVAMRDCPWIYAQALVAAGDVARGRAD